MILHFFAPWTPKGQKKISQILKLSKCTTVGPLHTFKRGLKDLCVCEGIRMCTPWKKLARDCLCRVCTLPKKSKTEELGKSRSLIEEKKSSFH